jgi:hypothetical protein
MDAQCEQIKEIILIAIDPKYHAAIKWDCESAMSNTEKPSCSVVRAEMPRRAIASCDKSCLERLLNGKAESITASKSGGTHLRGRLSGGECDVYLIALQSH